MFNEACLWPVKLCCVFGVFVCLCILDKQLADQTGFLCFVLCLHSARLKLHHKWTAWRAWTNLIIDFGVREYEQIRSCRCYVSSVGWPMPHKCVLLKDCAQVLYWNYTILSEYKRLSRFIDENENRQMNKMQKKILNDWFVRYINAPKFWFKVFGIFLICLLFLYFRWFR